MSLFETNNPGSEIADEGRQLQEFIRELTAGQGRIRAFIVSLMPGSPDVGDVLQETNLTLWKSKARYRAGSNFLAWAFTVARLEVMHQRARVKRDGRIQISEKLTGMLAREMPNAIDHETYLRTLESCMSKMTAKQRELVKARYLPGNSLEMLARITGAKSSALRVALLRIRTALRECIENTMKESYQ